MKLFDKPRWKLTATAIVCILGVMLLAGGSYAAYTRQAYQKGVARNRDTETISFTSNYLQLCGSGAQEGAYVVRNISYGTQDKEQTTLSFDLYVYNYPNGNKNLASQRDITYTMKIAFSEGTGSYTVKCDTDKEETIQKDGTYTVTKTLTGHAGKENKYTITIPGSDLDKVKITAVATPSDTTLTNNQMLAAVLVPSTSTSGASFRANGEFIDKTSGKPTDYDAYNYEVAISGGKATATLTWNLNIVEIDKFFLEKIGKSNEDIKKTDTGMASLTFDMNQAEGSGDYLISFYIKDKKQIPSTWPEMTKIVSFDATQKN